MTQMRDEQGCPSTMSLVELRRYLLRRASALAVRAKACSARGDVTSATRMREEATRLLRVARAMGRAGSF